MNNKGQIIITDLLLYLIVITLILSLIIFTMVTLNDNQVTRINNKQLNNILEHNFQVLIKTTGTPNNWEYLDNNEVKTIGLKSDNSHLIDYGKIIKLKNNKELLDKNFQDDVNYELTIYPKNNRNNKLLIAGTSLTNRKQVQSKSEVVLLDYGFNTTLIENNDNNEFCDYNHDNNWSCKSFSITRHSLIEGKYYLITNSKTEYILSNSYSENISGSTNTIINIDNILKKLLKNENETVYIHLNSNKNNTYLVYDSNNREELLKYVLEPEIYIINMKIAI